MKKTLKIIGISLLSLVGLVLVALGTACWLVFTPARLTPIVNKLADKYITCETQVESVNLTFFKTFPLLGLDVKGVTVINPVEGAATDTVAHVDRLTLSVDAMGFIKRGDIDVKGLDVADGTAYIYTSAQGQSNLDIFPSSGEDEDTTTLDIQKLNVDLRHVSVSGLRAALDDRKDSMNVAADGLDLTLKGNLTRGDLKADLDAAVRSAMLSMQGQQPMQGQVSGLRLKADAQKAGSDGRADVSVQSDDASLALDGMNVSAGKLNLKTIAAFNTDKKSADADVTLTSGSAALTLAGTAPTTADAGSTLAAASIRVAAKGMIEDYATRKGWNGHADVALAQPAVNMAGKSPLVADADAASLVVEGRYDGLMYEATPSVSLTSASVALGRDKYLTRAQVNVDATAQADTAFTRFEVTDGKVKLNQFDLAIPAATVSLPDSATLDADAHLITGQWNIREVLAMLPAPVRKALPTLDIHDGKLKLDATARAGIHDQQFRLAAANGKVAIDHLDGVLNDSIAVVAPQLDVTATVPARKTTGEFREFAEGTLHAPTAQAHITGLGKADVQALEASFSLSDITNPRVPFATAVNMSMESLNADLDTIVARADKPTIAFVMKSTKDARTHYAATVGMSALSGKVGHTLTAGTGSLAVMAKAEYDEKQTDLMARWNPDLSLVLSKGHARLADFPEEINVPHIQLAYIKDGLNVEDGSLALGKSDFHIKGDVTNLRQFAQGDGLLKARLDLTSNYTDVNEILDLVSGLGAKDSTATDVAAAQATFEDDAVKEDNPFIVPMGADVMLRTDIHTACWNGFDFNGVHGNVTCDNGVLVMEELGFTSKAATMQLTAMYKSPRKNHLFAGIDFHLLNVDIADLIDMIPAVDTIVPMLRTFDGRAQFHLAGESYLKSNYDLKLSTLRGAAAIEGADLVVLDNATFSTIKKYLMTDKQTENRIDSIDLELSVFKDEVDLYPFRVRLGEYEAIVGGRHNINRDLDFGYHISVTDCPLPVRLGLDVSGTLDNMKFKLVPPKYTNLYKPEKRGELQERTLELKNAINESLKRNVKSTEYYDRKE